MMMPSGVQPEGWPHRQRYRCLGSAESSVACSGAPQPCAVLATVMRHPIDVHGHRVAVILSLYSSMLTRLSTATLSMHSCLGAQTCPACVFRYWVSSTLQNLTSDLLWHIRSATDNHSLQLRRQGCSCRAQRRLRFVDARLHALQALQSLGRACSGQKRRRPRPIALCMSSRT